MTYVKAIIDKKRQPMNPLALKTQLVPEIPGSRATSHGKQSLFYFQTYYSFSVFFQVSLFVSFLLRVQFLN